MFIRGAFCLARGRQVTGFLAAGPGAWTCLAVFLAIVALLTYIIWTSPNGPRYDD